MDICCTINGTLRRCMGLAVWISSQDGNLKPSASLSSIVKDNTDLPHRVVEIINSYTAVQPRTLSGPLRLYRTHWLHAVAGACPPTLHHQIRALMFTVCFEDEVIYYAISFYSELSIDWLMIVQRKALKM